MLSNILLGGLGLIIVLSLFIGGSMLAGLCHEVFTPDLDFFGMIWHWIFLAPLWWLAVRSLSSEQFNHPVATYVGFLPFLVLIGALISQFGPGNPWLLPAMAIAYAGYFTIAERVGNLSS